MNGPEHYAEAERLIRAMDDRIPGSSSPLRTLPQKMYLAATAQAHATLALAAATALSGVIGNNVYASHPANQLADDPETISAVNDWHEVAAR
ncbi:hypothetical protein [Gordonia rubripertincta]|uniref:hypothetical protein n=1 Tax=Gordonia rubripertincta TaxID=36822 RepID=UPI0015F7FC16|nr:hypothetical protein [Gordonia rubripertincta]QMU22016.1 hypothetical protein H3V45_05875 [Gordonia rubripertincta]